MDNELRNNNTVSPEKWDNMSNDEKITFIQLKMNEAKDLNDEDQYAYWNANLQKLQEKKDNHYQQLMNAINKRRSNNNISEEEKQQILGEIYFCIDNLVKEANTDEEVINLVSKVIDDLNRDDFEKNIQQHIITDLQEKQNKKKKSSQQATNDNKEPDTKKSELQNSLDDLRGKLNKLQEEYHEMLSDGVIDENELEVLIRKINELSADADGLLMFIATQTERQILNSIIDNIQEEKMKMKKTLNNMKDVARTSM